MHISGNKRDQNLMFSAAGLILFFITAIAPVVAAPSTVRLADNGKALLPIIVSPKTSEGVRATAQTLADYLGKMSGAKFTVQNGDGTSGIVLGLPADFDKLPIRTNFPPG